MDSIQNNVDALTCHLVDLEGRRFSDPFANDVFEAAYHWRDLGKWVLEKNTKVNFPERAREELRFLNDLRKLLLKRPSDEQASYAPVFEVAEKILKAAETVHPSKGGHLNVLTVIRDQFRFLQEEYDFAIVREQ